MAIRKIAESIVDKTKFALVGTEKLLKRPAYIALFLLCMLLFHYFLTFFRDGSSNWQLLWSGLPFGRKLEVLGRIFPSMLDNFSSFYGWTIVLLSLLQALIIVQLVFACKNRKRSDALNQASAGGAGAILGFIALGCPSCGIGLLSPLLSAIAGGAAATLAEGIGFAFTILAFVLLIYSFIKLGYIDYIIISSKKEEHAKSN